MTHWEDIIAKRTEERHRRALAAWGWLEAEMLSLNVKPTLFGSLAKERFMAHSDIDVTVDLNGNAAARVLVEQAVARACRRWSVPVDLLFEDDLSDENLALLHAS
ncbi:MAG: nucleotidyltransferase domain-containing protein [Boseongicola sp. SB0662_bin_57]|nr:nucleotidyltransferase domain-containing protein [Boseongicola sp. SB0662_bin_57]